MISVLSDLAFGAVAHDCDGIRGGLALLRSIGLG